MNVSPNRVKWDRPVESLFAQIGYVVGLGNLWRFPYLCQKNGGGVFFIPYVIALMVFSIPLYLFEVGLGQMTSRGRIGAWGRRLPLMKGIGYTGLVLSLVSMVPYMLIMAWGILYFVHSFTLGPLKWTTCDNSWNTNSCVTIEHFVNLSKSVPVSDGAFNLSNQTVRPSVYGKESLAQIQFWRNYVLRIPNQENGLDGHFNWPVLCSLLAAFVTVFLVTIKGVKTSGKVVYVTATFPYVMLIALLVRGATLEGAQVGIRAYLLPDISKLATPQVWIEAMSQAIYTFGLGFCAVTTFGCYNKYNYNIYKYSFVVVGLGALSSFAMGFATFSVLGHLAHIQGVDIVDVMQSGPGLVFQVFPIGLSLMPAPQVWSAMFFLMIYFVAVDTSFSEFEGILAAIGDVFPRVNATAKTRLFSRATFGCAYFLVSLIQLPGNGIYIFELMNYYGSSGICLLWVALWESLTVGWLWDADRFRRDVHNMTGSYPSAYFKYIYQFVTPILSLAVLLFYIIKWKPLSVGDFVYPLWANLVGWLLSLASIICIPGGIIYVLWKGEGSLKERYRRGLQPDASLEMQDSSKAEMTAMVL